MKAYIIGYVAGLGVFLLLDFIWLVVLARNIYQRQLGYILAAKPKLVPAMIFYALFVLGLLVLIIAPFSNVDPTEILMRSALFGLVCYATYDLSNWATLRDWPVRIVIYDLLWGVFVTVCTAGGILSILKILNLVRLAS